MRSRKIEEEDHRKFLIGETVFSKENRDIKMTITRFSGKCYYCVMSGSQPEKEFLYFEEDLIYEWQIPFF